MSVFDWIIMLLVMIGFTIVASSPLFFLFKNENNKKNRIDHLNKMKFKMAEKLDNLSDFSPSQRVIGNDGASGIAFDEGRKEICLIKQCMGNFNLDVLSYQDILSSEIFEDGVTVTKTARGSQLGGALIGGLVLGGVGAIIGGLSGKTIASDKVN